MHTGQLTERITIETVPTTEDGVGALTPGTPVVVARLWAAKVVQGGREFPDLAGRLVAEVDVLWVIRRRTDLVARTMGVNHGGVLYDIEAVLELDPEKVWLTLACKSRAA